MIFIEIAGFGKGGGSCFIIKVIWYQIIKGSISIYCVAFAKDVWYHIILVAFELIFLQDFMEEIAPLVSIERQMKSIVACTMSLLSASTLPVDVSILTYKASTSDKD